MNKITEFIKKQGITLWFNIASVLLVILFLSFYPATAQNQQVDVQAGVIVCGVLYAVAVLVGIVLKQFNIKLFGLVSWVKVLFIFVAFGIFFMYSLEFLGLLSVYHYSTGNFTAEVFFIVPTLVLALLNCFIED